jgi:3-(3-hydroxy-phenyl)propionate hydroxylase
MAPPNFAFRLMREATLRLAVSDDKVRPLINPRQSAPAAYRDSALNGPAGGDWPGAVAGPGMPAPEALLDGFHLTECFGERFTCLVFSEDAPPALPPGVRTVAITRAADRHGQARDRHGLAGDATGLVLVRPDGYILGRWRGLDPAPVRACLQERGLA